jgi:hypothetical protein
MAHAARAVWDFIVGDDWRVAVGVGVAIAATALVATSAVASWWVLPTGVIALLVNSTCAHAAHVRAIRL